MLVHQAQQQNESPIAPPTLPFSRAELDVLGFVRSGPDETCLDAWWRLLNGASVYDTPESAAARAAIEHDNKKCKPKERTPVSFGIAIGSEAWNDASTVGITLRRVPQPPPPPQPDLFAEPLSDVDRYAIAEEDLIEPKAFGGPPPDRDEIADRYGYEENGLAIAWDAERILVSCPRGACLIPRDRWAKGYRSCPGC